MEQEHKQLVIGILAHVDSGKTTLSEALLYGTGTIRKLGRVDHKDAFLDTDALEKARGITIFSKQALFTAGNTDFTLLDTPGHVDFSTETERTLQVLDYAVLVISGTDGVQSHTETLWRLLRRYHIPTFVFVNKMNLPGPGREALLIRHRIPPARNIKSTGKQISFFRISVQVLITRSTVMQIFTLLMISPFSHIVRRHSFHRKPRFLSPSVQIVSMRCSFPCYENGYSFL